MINKKTILVGVLTGSLLTGTLAFASGSNQKVYFEDIKNHCAQNVIHRYASMGIVKGMNDGAYKPDLRITRVQFFAMLHRGLDIQNRYFVAPDITKIYKDANNEDWYAIIAYDLQTNGIIDDKELLRGNELITREEMAHYAVNAFNNAKGFKNEEVQKISKEVKDIDKSSKKYINDIYHAYNLKIMGGKPGGVFDPKGISTRAEGVVVVNNLLKALGYDNMEPIKIEPSYVVDANGLKMILRIVNQSSKPIQIQHMNGQKYDFELLDADKNVIYKWSTDRTFIQIIENTDINKSSSVEFSEKFDYKGNESIIESAKYLVCHLKGRIEDAQISPSEYTVELDKKSTKIPDLAGEQEPLIRNGNIFGIINNGKRVYLGDWDDKVDLSSIFGVKVSEALEVLPSTADTFAGSYLKKVSFDGAKVELFSSKSNGKTFWIMKIVISDSKYGIVNKVKVGDSVDKLFVSFLSKDITILPDGRMDKNNCAYIVKNINDSSSVIFEVENGIIKFITLEKSLM